MTQARFSLNEIFGSVSKPVEIIGVEVFQRAGKWLMDVKMKVYRRSELLIIVIPDIELFEVKGNTVYVSGIEYASDLIIDGKAYKTLSGNNDGLRPSRPSVTKLWDCFTRKMTIGEIEEMLGHPVEVVKDE